MAATSLRSTIAAGFKRVTPEKLRQQLKLKERLGAPSPEFWYWRLQLCCRAIATFLANSLQRIFRTLDMPERLNYSANVQCVHSPLRALSESYKRQSEREAK